MYTFYRGHKGTYIVKETIIYYINKLEYSVEPCLIFMLHDIFLLNIHLWKISCNYYMCTSLAIGIRTSVCWFSVLRDNWYSLLGKYLTG